jgi:hypothetical protein
VSSDDHDHIFQHASPAKPPCERAGGLPVVGRATIALGTGGLALGAAIGVVLGAALYAGRLSISGLAPLVAGGRGVPVVILGTLLGALFGLAGGIFGVHRDARVLLAGREEPHSETAHRGAVRHLPLIGLMLLVLGMVLTLAIISSHAVGGGQVSRQDNRIVWNLKNTIRIGAETDTDTQLAALSAAYPATRVENRPKLVLDAPDGDWRLALAATPLIARPHDAMIVVGPLHDPTLARATMGVPHETLAGDPVRLAAQIDARIGAAMRSRAVMVVAADAAAAWAMPAAAYAARTGTSILFVNGGVASPVTREALARRQGWAAMYLLGPRRAFPHELVRSLEQYGRVHRVGGADPALAAVAFAELRDDDAAFGWGHDGRGAQRRASVTTILVDPDRWQDAVAAAHLARRGRSGPILFTGADRLPGVVDVHLWRERPVFLGTPAEGPFNSVWVVGSFDRIGYGVQAWADYSQEIEQYMTRGPSAVSGFEALAIAWLILCFASAIWVAVHARRILTGVMPEMKLAWTSLALLLGPLALVLYVRSYHRRERHERDGMVMWHRPPVSQAVSATAMMFGFDMLAMVLAVFALGYLGYPIWRFDGPLFWVGTSMFLMMVGMYFVALVVVMLLFHGPMTAQERKVSYARALLIGLPMMAMTMLVESIGMMPAMWWQQMSFLPGMQMPAADDLTMWATLLISVLAGFLVVLPFNYLMVKHGRKSGSM